MKSFHTDSTYVAYWRTLGGPEESLYISEPLGERLQSLARRSPEQAPLGDLRRGLALMWDDAFVGVAFDSMLSVAMDGGWDIEAGFVLPTDTPLVGPRGGVWFSQWGIDYILGLDLVPGCGYPYATGVHLLNGGEDHPYCLGVDYEAYGELTPFVYLTPGVPTCGFLNAGEALKVVA